MPADGLRGGFDYPLYDAATVGLTKLHGTRERTCLVGFELHADAPGPFTADSVPQNRLLTPGGNHLLLDATRSARAIMLETLERTCLLGGKDTSGAAPPEFAAVR